jgi:hypothetical protein
MRSALRSSARSVQWSYDGIYRLAGGPFKPVVGLSGVVPASGGRNSERAINGKGNRSRS